MGWVLVVEQKTLYTHSCAAKPHQLAFATLVELFANFGVIRKQKSQCHTVFPF